ncbi:hypothetical protein M9H77_02258 [Catharanthus roseus]|uniref:Uncharacterized protein n=1 Tax=Catharanthus roseus TaxID=4058 RepID=A0ACC0C7X5_CATRO|nr:hypothetical protein M9H77_02258 [Catharanthus roseus]
MIFLSLEAKKSSLGWSGDDGIALKAEHYSSNATSYSEEEVICSFKTLESFFVEPKEHLNHKGGLRMTTGDDDKKSDSKDDKEDTDYNETLAFNVIIELEDTSTHINHKDDSDDDSIYSDEEVSYEKLQDKCGLLYTKWVGLV